MQSVGEQLKFFRKESNITQKQLSELTGIAEITIRQYEAGKYKPKLDNLKKISDVLQIPLAALLDLDETDQALNALWDVSNIDVYPSQYTDMFNLRELKPYFSLNQKGKKKAMSYIEDLAKLPEYTD